ncbi:hypothetical protein I3J27_07700 [Bradyrhizobium xenonodulans]|uniref:O-antigen ligase domain-containing protein n=1 Tax=Bradyrhizobium xenonodulans TaxID=2736875 RepID=A0ABY7MQT1_9BRAD|nr:hypothetical protein [Bradyrhizobium xenonodulans]WBL80296.1 hypothetical protein I3J27_07700 [Bradyrhizobium xenonodulans]
MSIAFSLLIALLVATPAALFISYIFAQHALYLLTAIMLASVATAASPADIIAAATFRRFAWAALFPIAWMMIQIVPLPIESLTSPIWPTAAVALNDPSLASRISIDPGSTLRSLTWYLAVLSLIISTILLARDRNRAEVLLLTLTGAATFIALESLAGQIEFLATALPDIGRSNSHSFAVAAVIAALGNSATIAMAMERHSSRAGAIRPLSTPLLFRIALGVTGIVVSLASLAALGQRVLLGLTGFGFAIMLFVATARRLGFRPWPSAILAAVLIAMTAVATLSLARSTPLVDLLSFVISDDQASLAVARRALSDSSWTGSGVGTFARLARIYQDYGVGSALAAPSTAALVAIEWGRVAIPVLAGFTLQLFLFALRGAVGRGRDSFFASATAAIVVVVLCGSFVDGSLLNPTAQIMLAAAIGLGLAQSTGRTSSI